MSRPRIIVAGANYGRAYLRAIAEAGGAYECVGLLTSGGESSAAVAREFGQTLYRSVDELPRGIDLVCAAMGKRGTAVVLELLGRGIPVLCEHPVTPDFVEQALEAAYANRCPFHVNGHFPMLAASREFFVRYADARRETVPVLVEVTATDRSLYAALDVLRHALDGGTNLQTQWAQAQAPLVTIGATIDATPALFRVQIPAREPIADGSAEYLVDYRLALVFPQGTLALLSMGGPVVWTANYAAPEARPEATIRAATRTQASRRELSEQRNAANREAIARMLGCIGGAPVPLEQQPEHLLRVSGWWRSLARLLGHGGAAELHFESLQK